MAGRGRGLTLPAWMTNTANPMPNALSAGHGVPPVGIAPPFNPALAQGPSAHGQMGRGAPMPHPPPGFPNAPMPMPLGVNPPFPGAPPAAAPKPEPPVWSEHVAPGGQKYYYNRITKESSWTKPADFHGPNPNPVAQAPNNPASQNAPSAPAVKAEDLEEARKLTPSIGKVMTSTQETEAPTKKDTKEFATKEEKVEAFKSLLLESDIKSDWNWEMAVRVLMSDSRYELLKTGEKKQLFNEHVAHLKNKEKEVKREKEKKAKDDFVALLASKPEIVVGLPYRKAIMFLDTDTRFHGIISEREREETYMDYLVDLERKQKEAQRNERAENRRNFRLMLEETESITARTTWRKAQELLQQDRRFKKVQDSIERLVIFEEYVRGLERVEEAEKAQVREEQRRTERHNREEFRAYIQRLILEGKMDITTRWRGFVAVAKDAPEFMNMIGQTGTTPKEIFFDSLFELEDEYEEQKKVLKDLVKDVGLKITPTTTADELLVFFAKYERTHPFPKANIAAYIQELLEKAASKQKKLEKRYFRLLKKKRVDQASKFEEVKEKLASHSAYKDISTDDERAQLFAKYQAKLSEKENHSDESASDESDRDDDQYRKDDRDRGSSRKHRKSRRSESPERRKERSKRSETPERDREMDRSPKSKKHSERDDEEYRSKKSRRSP
eukprot:TRINITY_DN1661_c0_g1_i5.p1 TRINITY_DN1661_c0_g1~~TRINITY_DN1661_c0_g1_i5.p1  ORF type:complete len:670 (+),score=161.36 TRINITY_DN1661_c0_g1_i5:56-2065(+)